MIGDVTDLLCCPRCTAPMLVPAPGTVGCDTGHRFDIARQGHVNLLSRPAPANADTAAMVQARERHLHRGEHDAVRQLLVARSGPTVLDAGCGPGWYSSALPDATRVVGLDLSVAAARRAARVRPTAGVLVTDLRDPLPMADHAVDTVWSVFAPRPVDEFARVLRPGGSVLVVLPGPDHLAELVDADLVIGQQADKEERLVAQFGARFRAVDRQATRVVVEATPDRVADVVAMGPSAHHRTAGQGPDGELPATMTVSLVLREFRC